jgi:hypothetical protein
MTGHFSSEIDELVCSYRAGRTLAHLAADLGVHQRTVAAHLDSRGVARRLNRRKMSDDDVSAAALRYRNGNSLATLALTLNGAAATASERSPTDSSASSTAASTATPSTTNTPPGHTANQPLSKKTNKPLDNLRPCGV